MQREVCFRKSNFLGCLAAILATVVVFCPKSEAAPANTAEAPSLITSCSEEYNSLLLQFNITKNQFQNVSGEEITYSTILELMRNEEYDWLLHGRVNLSQSKADHMAHLYRASENFLTAFQKLEKNNAGKPSFITDTQYHYLNNVVRSVCQEVKDKFPNMSLPAPEGSLNLQSEEMDRIIQEVEVLAVYQDFLKDWEKILSSGEQSTTLKTAFDIMNSHFVYNMSGSKQNYSTILKMMNARKSNWLPISEQARYWREISSLKPKDELLRVLNESLTVFSTAFTTLLKTKRELKRSNILKDIKDEIRNMLVETNSMLKCYSPEQKTPEPIEPSINDTQELLQYFTLLAAYQTFLEGLEKQFYLRGQ